TRSAAALVALLEVAATRGETVALLDLLKAPFAFADDPERGERLMEIEHALRRDNVLGGWERVQTALRAPPQAQAVIRRVADQAGILTGRKALARWSETPLRALHALGMRGALQGDHAGRQVTSLLELLALDEADAAQEFSFSEWRAFLGLQ